MNSKHTLVVGGTRGIGRAIAKEFSDQGHRVSVIGRREPERPLDNVTYWLLDVLDTGQLAAAWPQIAGDRAPDNVIFTQRFRGQGDDWWGEIDTGLTATRNIIEFLVGNLNADAETSIVVVSSVASQSIVSEQPAGYHVAKAGLDQLVRYYAVTLGAKNLRINCISPGTVVKEESREFYRENKVIADLYGGITPLGRMATSEDIAGVAWFLCSQGASFITGQNIVVDGGLSLVGHQSLARQLAGLDHIETTQRPSKETK